PPALEVATAVAEARGLRLAGLQAYEGHCQLVFDPWEQRRRAFESYERLLATRQRLGEAGLRLPWVTTAGTGTYPLAIEHGRVSALGPVREGDRVWLVPSHCDTTINLHDRYVLVRDDGRVQGTLPVAARGRSA